MSARGKHAAKERTSYRQHLA